VQLQLSVAVAVKVYVPDLSGVPDRIPPLESARPVGSEPEVTLNE
jgi:hypothetical protein